jgi:heptaprenyl diphosphate synthase
VQLIQRAEEEEREAVPFWEGFPSLQSDLKRVTELVTSEAAEAGGSVGHALEQYVARPGKLLRPAFVIIGSWAGRTRAGNLRDCARRAAHERVIQLAAAVETLHLATLIHDDVIDDSPMRRGAPSLHSVYGRKTAVLMGDFLLTRCFSMIAEGTTRESAQRLARATGYICSGEIRQLDDTGRSCLSRREYRRRIMGKTALLFGLSLTVGAHEYKATRRDQGLLARAGYSIGMAFQIIDDVLDLTADSVTLGKPTAGDLRQGVYTLPVVEALLEKPELRKLVVPPPENAYRLAEAVRAIIRAGGVARAREAARLYTNRAERAIGELESSHQREVLRHSTTKLLHREY